MKNTGHYYAVTRVHSRELELLTNQDIQHLSDLKTLKECFDFLAGKGWGDSSMAEMDSHALLAQETNKTWSFMEELIGDIKPFDVFRFSHDFNNLKAVVKLNYTHKLEGDIDRYFMPYGTIPREKLIEAARCNSYSGLPEPLNHAGEEASLALSRTGNGQDCDVIIDNYALKSIFDSAKASGNQLLIDYAVVTVDISNIKIAIRAQHMHKSEGFLKRALVDCGSLNKQSLVRAALSSQEDILAYLRTSSYSGAVPMLEQSMAAFESWCHSKLIEEIKPQKYAIDGLEPLAAYILARENEISMVRLILSAKTNNLDQSKTRERMREMYV